MHDNTSEWRNPDEFNDPLDLVVYKNAFSKRTKFILFQPNISTSTLIYWCKMTNKNSHVVVVTANYQRVSEVMCMSTSSILN